MGLQALILLHFKNFDCYFADAALLSLQNNYRSQPNIVAQGNAFMAKTQGAPSVAKATLKRAPIY